MTGPPPLPPAPALPPTPALPASPAAPPPPALEPPEPALGMPAAPAPLDPEPAAALVPALPALLPAAPAVPADGLSDDCPQPSATTHQTPTTEQASPGRIVSQHTALFMVRERVARLSCL